MKVRFNYEKYSLLEDVLFNCLLSYSTAHDLSFEDPKVAKRHMQTINTLKNMVKNRINEFKVKDNGSLSFTSFSHGNNITIKE